MLPSMTDGRAGASIRRTARRVGIRTSGTSLPKQLSSAAAAISQAGPRSRGRLDREEGTHVATLDPKILAAHFGDRRVKQGRERVARRNLGEAVVDRPVLPGQDNALVATQRLRQRLTRERGEDEED